MNALVYSTDSGKTCPQCRQPENDCLCQQLQAEQPGKSNGKVIISHQTKGRKGKGVSVVSGLPLNQEERKALGKELKKLCGSGGAVKGENIEIQGDFREKLKDFLQQRGYLVKISGK